MTNSQRMRESAVMISSTIPSAKYSCSGSPLMFWKGSTAMEGLSGSGSGWLGIEEAFAAGVEAPRAHGFGDVLQGLRANIIVNDVDFSSDLAIGVVRNANAARLRDPL